MISSNGENALSPRREIVHKGQLQQKILKRSGTLLRKKKTVYEDELWVVLCIHEGGNGGIPHLEWYGDLRTIFEHRPLKVQDLLECQYVNVAIGEERCFVIGFVDKTRPMLELSAPSIEERKQWVDTLTRTLHRLNCLVDGENENEITNGNNSNFAGPRAENEYIAFAEREAENRIGNNVNEEEESAHVPLTQIHNQMLSLSMTSVSLSTPTTLRRMLCLRDKIPMLDQPLICIPNYLTPADDTQRIPGDENRPNKKELRPGCSSNSEVDELYSQPASTSSPKQTSFDDGISPGKRVKSPKTKDAADDDDSRPPPLPPRMLKSSLSISNTQASMPIMPTSPIPSSPPQKLTEYDILNAPSTSLRSQYDQLCPSESNGHLSSQHQKISRLSSEPSDPVSSSNMSSRCSSTRNSGRPSSVEDPQPSTSVSAQQQYDVLCSPPPLQYDVLSALPPSSSAFMSSPDQIFRESLSRPRRISFSLAILAENVAFVELAEKVWIAGWSPKADTNLRDILNVGDMVEQMNGIKLRSVHQIPGIYASVKPGIQVQLALRLNPTMKMFTLIRPQNPKRELGIVLHKGKNKIASIEPKSAADQANVPATMPAYFFHPVSMNRQVGAAPGTGTIGRLDNDDRTTHVRAVITQLNGVPLSLFARNDQFFARMQKIPVGQSINFALQPADFCTQLGRQMKAQLRNWRNFVHDS